MGRIYTGRRLIALLAGLYPCRNYSVKIGIKTLGALSILLRGLIKRSVTRNHEYDLRDHRNSLSHKGQRNSAIKIRIVTYLVESRLPFAKSKSSLILHV